MIEKQLESDIELAQRLGEQYKVGIPLNWILTNPEGIVFENERFIVKKIIENTNGIITVYSEFISIYLKLDELLIRLGIFNTELQYFVNNGIVCTYEVVKNVYYVPDLSNPFPIEPNISLPLICEALLRNFKAHISNL